MNVIIRLMFYSPEMFLTFILLIYLDEKYNIETNDWRIAFLKEKFLLPAWEKSCCLDWKHLRDVESHPVKSDQSDDDAVADVVDGVAVDAGCGDVAAVAAAVVVAAAAADY